MPRYHLNFVDPTGKHVAHVIEQEFADLSDARREAIRILSELVADSQPRQGPLGAIEVCDEAGLCLAEFHLPEV